MPYDAPDPYASREKAWHICQAFVYFFPSSHSLGHTGLCISHHCFDRAVASAVPRKILQWKTLYYTLQEGESPEKDEALALQRDYDWTVSTGCACHNVHNSLNTSLSDVPPSRLTLMIGSTKSCAVGVMGMP